MPCPARKATFLELAQPLNLQWDTQPSYINQHQNDLNPRMQDWNYLGFYLINHVSTFKMIPKLFQQPACSGNFINFHTLHAVIAVTNLDKDTQLYSGVWRPWSIHPTVIFKTMDSADNRCKLMMQRSLLFHWLCVTWGHNYGRRIGYTRITVYSGFSNTRYKI